MLSKIYGHASNIPNLFTSLVPPQENESGSCCFSGDLAFRPRDERGFWMAPTHFPNFSPVYSVGGNKIELA